MMVVRCADLPAGELAALLERFGMVLESVPPGAPVPGSYWGGSEAGLIGNRLLIRSDTPLHSALHETCHYVCMDTDRRRTLHTDAGGDDLEECAVCYLQILLSDEISGGGRVRLFMDMDAWGYSFRLGSTRAWFEKDACDAERWLLERGILGRDGRIARLSRR